MLRLCLQAVLQSKAAQLELMCLLVMAVLLMQTGLPQPLTLLPLG